MTTKNKHFWQIEMAAEELLKLNECFDAPFDGIDRMIESCKIDLIPLDIHKDKLCGFFGRDKNDIKCIGYNKNMIPERILFTKAHELGHFILKHNLKGEFLYDLKFKNKDIQETQANVFAAALLMPKEKVIEIIKIELGDKYILTTTNENINLTEHEIDNLIYKVMGKFKTSQKASCYRLKNILNLT